MVSALAKILTTRKKEPKFKLTLSQNAAQHDWKVLKVYNLNLETALEDHKGS